MNKKFVYTLFLAMMFFWILPIYDASAGTIEWITVDGIEGGQIEFDTETGTIKGCENTVTSADIPEKINDVTVTKIGWGAFSQCSNLKNITIPKGVDVDGNAFYQCTNLKSITLPDSVTSIRYSTFYQCTNLSSITLPKGLISIESDAFCGCSSLKNINIPNSVTSIGRAAFLGCSSLSNVILPKGLTSIEREVFCDCSSLKSISIPEQVTEIGSGAFWRCYSLTSVILPDSLTSISNLAFSECTSLESITLPDGLTDIGQGAFSKCTSLESIHIPDGIKIIPSLLLQSCASLSSVVLPEELTRVEWGAFLNCSGLNNITIPDGVTEINKETFFGCKNLNSIMLPEGIKNIRERAFDQCSKLENVYYNGSMENWSNISVENGNYFLLSAKIYCNDECYCDIPNAQAELYKVAAATCTEDGYTGDVVCATCHGIIEKGEKIDKFGHTFSEWKITEATIDKDGLKERVCFVCGFLDRQTIYYPLRDMCTKAQLAMFLWRTAGEPSFEPIEFTYQDVKKDAYYYDAVCWALKNHIMLGAQKNYEPERELTRAEVIVILQKLFVVISPEDIKLKDIDSIPYTDIDKESWYYPAVVWAYASGIALDTDDHLFRPIDICTIEEVLGFIKCAADMGYCEEVSIITSIDLDKDAVVLDDQEKCYLLADIYPNGVNEDKLVWSSSDPSVAVVDEKGMVTAVNPGIATITLTSCDGGEVLGCCKVTVEAFLMEEGFDLKTDGYSILNTMAGFGYDSDEMASGEAGYKVPLERYQEVYGSAYTEEIYNQNVAFWNGNCFGMDITSAMFYKGILPLTDYISDGATLNESGYNEINTLDSSCAYLKLNRNSNLTKLIERYQIWLNSNEWNLLYDNVKNRYSTAEEMFVYVLERVKSKKEPFLIAAEWKTDDGAKVGHTLLVDSFRTPEDQGGGWKKIYVYDPNNPYYGKFGDVTPHDAYLQAQNRTVMVNTETGEWKLNIAMNSDEEILSIGYDDAGSLLRESSICFMDVDDFPADFSVNATFVPTDESTHIVYNSDDFEIYDAENNLVYQRADGVVVYDDEEIIEEAVQYGVASEEKGYRSGKLILPKGEYQVNMDRGAVAYLSDGKYSGVATQDKVTVNNTDLMGLSVVSDSEVSVNVVVGDMAGRNDYTIVSTNLAVDNRKCAVSVLDDKLSVESEKKQSVDVKITTEKNVMEIKGMVVNGNTSIALDEYKNTSLNSTSVYIARNNVYDLNVTDSGINIDWEIEWKSSDNTIASVSEDGLITAKKEGTAIITAIYEGMHMECNVTVLEKEPYTDVIRDNDWFYDSVAYCYANGLMTGKSEAVFAPYESLARAQFASILYRINGVPEVDFEPIFPDVEEGMWYTTPIIWAKTTGVVNGYSDGRFGPGDEITREQMVLMMYNYAKSLQYDISARGNMEVFWDAENVSWYAKDAMRWAVGAGLITGKDNGTRLDPYGNTSRAECAVIIRQFMAYAGD